MRGMELSRAIATCCRICCGTRFTRSSIRLACCGIEAYAPTGLAALAWSVRAGLSRRQVHPQYLAEVLAIAVVEPASDLLDLGGTDITHPVGYFFDTGDLQAL